jgi:hypothetical protein
LGRRRSFGEVVQQSHEVVESPSGGIERAANIEMDEFTITTPMGAYSVLRPARHLYLLARPTIGESEGVTD